MFRDSLEGFSVGAVLTGLCYLFGYQMGWIIPYAEEPNLMFGLEVVGVFLNFSCVWLCVRQKIANWWIGILAVIILGIFFFKANLLASMTLSLVYFLPIQFWGWYYWLKGGSNGRELDVSYMDVPGYIQIALIGAIAWYAITQINIYFGGSMPGFDVGILVLSVIAQYLMSLKKIESWGFWFAVNVLSVYVYTTSGAYLLGAQYFLFLLNAAYGGYQWRKAYASLNAPVKFGRVNA